jgi:hypothetical protein
MYSCNNEQHDEEEVSSGSAVCVMYAMGFPQHLTFTIINWPHQSEAPVGTVPPTRSQLRLQRQTETKMPTKKRDAGYWTYEK